jgi:signal transduction histidine kinase
LLNDSHQVTVSTRARDERTSAYVGTASLDALGETVPATIGSIDNRPTALVFRTLDQGRDSRYATVGLLSDLSDIRRAGRISATWLAAGGLLGVALLAWLAHRIGLTITVPIQHLAVMADRIAQGDRSARAEIRRRDELGTLAYSLNAMAERLAAYERELVEKNRLAALGNMAARVAHEIRNPLTAIKLQIQLLGESLREQAQPGLIAGLEDEISRLDLIVTGVLNQGRECPPRVDARPGDLNALVTEVARLFSPQFAHQGIEIETQLDPLPILALDADQMKQVLVNLLVNARDALPEGGKVLLRSWHDQTSGDAWLSIEDSGPGIPLDAEGKPLPQAGTAKPYGLGLGLRLSRELIAAHGGRIEFGASRLGGAAVRLIYPILGAPT